VAEAAPLAEHGAVTGWAALRLHGGGFFDGVQADGVTQRLVAIVVPGRARRPRSGVVFSRDRLADAEIATVLGIRVTSVRRALFDEMRTAPDVREAVVAMDMAAAARLTSIARMTTYTEKHTGWAGVEQVRRALRLADEDARSPQEVRARLIWVLDAGLPKPLVNPPLFTREGRLLGYADLLDPAAGLVLEYDGDDHRAARRHSRDVDREAAFRNVLLEVTRATGADVRNRSTLSNRLLEARARARFLKPGQRRWTVEPPEDWQFELPLDVELDLAGEPP